MLTFRSIMTRLDIVSSSGDALLRLTWSHWKCPAILWQWFKYTFQALLPILGLFSGRLNPSFLSIFLALLACQTWLTLCEATLFARRHFALPGRSVWNHELVILSSISRADNLMSPLWQFLTTYTTRCSCPSSANKQPRLSHGISVTAIVCFFVTSCAFLLLHARSR